MIRIEMSFTFLSRHLLAGVDDRNPTIFTETRFPISTRIAVGEVRNNESGGQEGRPNLVINQTGGLLISQDAELETCALNGRPEALFDRSLEHSFVEFHRHEGSTTFQSAVSLAFRISPSLQT
jgi:hypothetical protein